METRRSGVGTVGAPRHHNMARRRPLRRRRLLQGEDRVQSGDGAGAALRHGKRTRRGRTVFARTALPPGPHLGQGQSDTRLQRDAASRGGGGGDGGGGPRGPQLRLSRFHRRLRGRRGAVLSVPEVPLSHQLLLRPVHGSPGEHRAGVGVRFSALHRGRRTFRLEDSRQEQQDQEGCWEEVSQLQVNQGTSSIIGHHNC